MSKFNIIPNTTRCQFKRGTAIAEMGNEIKMWNSHMWMTQKLLHVLLREERLRGDCKTNYLNISINSGVLNTLDSSERRVSTAELVRLNVSTLLQINSNPIRGRVDRNL